MTESIFKLWKKIDIDIYILQLELQDMGIDDPDFIQLVKEVEGLEQKLFAHPFYKVTFMLTFYCQLSYEGLIVLDWLCL